MGVIDYPTLFRQAERLARLAPGSTPEAEIFYCARMLEGATFKIVWRLSGKASTNCLSNLGVLQQTYGLLDGVFQELAHTLRRMGNKVRHYLDDATPDDARLARVLMAETFQWLFRIDPEQETPDMKAIASAVCDPESREASIVALLKQVGEGRTEARRALMARFAEVEASPHVASLAATYLIAVKDWPDAEKVLSASRARFPDDLRLRTVELLMFSRRGQLGKAEPVADELSKRAVEDGEIMGICGGVYKRLWEAVEAKTAPPVEKGRTRPDPLKRSHECYFKPWERGGRIDTYIGINAATTALLLGREADARAYAAEVVRVLERRDGQIRASGLKPKPVEDMEAYYRDVTLAEAKLLAGQTDAAMALYRRAFVTYASYSGLIEGTRKQAQAIARASGLGRLGLLRHAGISGHRPHRLPEAARPKVAAEIGEALDLFWKDSSGVLYSGLAEGADMMAAAAARARGWKTVALLAFPAADFEQDFPAGAPRDDFRTALAHCSEAVEGAPRAALGDEVEGYEAASAAVIARCEALIAVWDGGRERKRAGAYDTMLRALEAGRPVYRIDANGVLPPRWFEPGGEAP
jgi:hypothetical protein